jgi:hypothetical protein
VSLWQNLWGEREGGKQERDKISDDETHLLLKIGQFSWYPHLLCNQQCFNSWVLNSLGPGNPESSLNQSTSGRTWVLCITEAFWPCLEQLPDQRPCHLFWLPAGFWSHPLWTTIINCAERKTRTEMRASQAPGTTAYHVVLPLQDNLFVPLCQVKWPWDSIQRVTCYAKTLRSMSGRQMSLTHTGHTNADPGGMWWTGKITSSGV